jgi:predicted dehydrogenase
MSESSNRREFLTSAAAAGFTIWTGRTAHAGTQSPNDRVNFACVGVGGKGDSDSNDAGRNGNVVAICDVDDNTLAKAKKRFPNAQVFNDYRVMMDKMHKSVDAVTVSTPDHNHAAAAFCAMHYGKACFVQKPMAHSVFEVRRLCELAKEKKVATQMGNQGTAEWGLRQAAAKIRKGALGTVTEVHVWTNRPIWPQGMERPATGTPPANLHWDLWLGPAAERPYGEGYHPFAWRGFWAFGTGALGDMACHTVNLPYQALDLRDPIAVTAQSAPCNMETYPVWSVIKYEFPKTDKRPAITMTWYDGGKKPPQDLLPEHRYRESGSLMIGDKGRAYSPGDYGSNCIFIDGVDVGEVDYKRSPGHFEEWVAAIKGGEPAMSNFPNYAGPLAETILLGNLAVAGSRVEWDASAMRARRHDVSEIIHPKYRSGYHI